MTRVKDQGFYYSRKRERRRFVPLPRWLWLLALLALLLIIGATQAWPQSSGSSSSSSSSDLTAWEQLSRKFMTDLDGQSTLLRQALTELETSKASSLKSMLLLEQSLKANAGLKTYNAQIARRMQERDEELAAAYAEINRLEKRVLKLVIAAASLGAVLAFILILKLTIKG